jgi:hypothetical protein
LFDSSGVVFKSRTAWNGNKLFCKLFKKFPVTKSSELDETWASLRLRTFNIEPRAGNKKEQIDKYNSRKHRKTQKSCEKKQKVSNWGIINYL